MLVIHLKRFSYQNFILRGKIDKFVKFPIKFVRATSIYGLSNPTYTYTYLTIAYTYNNMNDLYTTLLDK